MTIISFNPQITNLKYEAILKEPLNKSVFEKAGITISIT